MHPETSEVAAHMKEFGLCTIGRAVYDATFAEITKPVAHAMSVTLAAHGAEILVKARIAQEHPLLIFDNLPRATTTSEMLTIEQLLEYGKTVGYSELPDLLWATTGYRMSAGERFLRFGRLRNAIAHFAVPAVELEGETLRFVFEVIDPMVGDFWHESVVPYAQEWDPEVTEGYLQMQLERLSLRALNPKTQAALAPTDE